MPGTNAGWDGLPLLMSTEEASQLLRVHVNTIKALCRSGKLPANKVGREWRINRADLIKMVAAREEVGAPASQPDSLLTPAQLTFLRQVDRAVFSARSPRDIAAAAVESLRAFAGCRRASVILFLTGSGEAEFAAVSTSEGTSLPTQIRVPLSAVQIPECFYRGAPYLAADLASDRTSGPLVPALLKEGIRSHLSIPLLAEDRLLGSLNLAHSSDIFDPTLLETASEVAASLAVAIDNAQHLERVGASRQQLQEFSRRLVQVQEDERRHLSRELHDETGQLMTALQLRLSRLKRHAGSTGAVRQELDEVSQITDSVAEGLHRLVSDLRPPALDQYGLTPALAGYIQAYERQTGIKVDFVADGTGIGRLTNAVETALYRLIQEGLTNAARHAHATAVSISLCRVGDNIQLKIEDNGSGFNVDAALARGRLGLLGMRERAEMLGGTLTIISRPSLVEGGAGGTSIELELPCPPAERVAAVDPARQAVEAPAAGVRAGEGPAGASSSMLELADLARAKALGDALNDLHADLGRLTEHDAILSTALERSARAIGCPLAVLYTEEAGEWVAQPCCGPRDILQRMCYSGEAAQFLSQIAAAGKLLVIDDAQAGAELAPELPPQLLTRAAIFVPLTFGGSRSLIAGFLEHAEPRRFTAAELDFAERLQVSLSLALENARLRETERRQTAELAAANALNSVLQDAIPDLLWSSDGEGRAEYANKRWQEYTGLTVEELNRQGWQAVNHPDDARRLAQAWAEAAAGGTPFESEYRYRRHDGVYRWFWGRAVPLKDESGSVTRWVGVSTEIEDRRIAEEDVRRLNRDLERQAGELQAVLEAIPDGLVVYDEAGRIVRLNETATGMLGYSEQDRAATLEERAGGGLNPRKSDGTPLQMDQLPARRALRGEVVLGLEMILAVPARGGGDLHMIVSSAPIRGADGSVKGCVTTFTDREAVHQANALVTETISQLRRANAELEAVLAAMPSGLIVYDATGRITRMNRVALEMLGYREDTWKLPVAQRVGSAVVAYNPDGSVTAHDDYVAIRALRGEAVHNQDLYIHLPESPERDFWGSFSSGPIYSAEGVFAGAVVTMTGTGRLHDLNDRLAAALRSVEQREAALAAANQQLREAAEMLEQRVEERTEALEVSRSQLKSLSRRLVDLQELERRYVADQLYNEAGQVLAALKMQLSRSAERGGTSLHVAEAQQLLDRVMQDLHHLATTLRPATLDRLGLIAAIRQYAEAWGREHGVAVTFMADTGGGLRLTEETETAIYRVVQEALSNTARHAAASAVSVDVQAMGGRLTVTVRDNGVGFEPTATAARASIGLLGMRERAESVGGRLRIESSPGNGAAVVVEAPIDRGRFS